MSAEKIKMFICNYEQQQPENNVNIYFSRRMSAKYVTHMPLVSDEVQKGIASTVLPYVKEQLNQNAIVEYNPVGVVDGEIESMESINVSLVQEFLNSITPENIYKEMNTLKIDKIGFYCVEIVLDNQKLFLFRQFQKLTKLRKGYMTRIVRDELTAMNTDFLGIDETTDIILFENEIFLLNHISLERIFEYKDEFLKKTNEALGEILNKNVIANIDQFAEDCCRDVRITKRFTNIMTKGRLPLFFDNYDKVPEIVEELGLDIEFDRDGKLVYKEKSQLFHIINLLSDSYFKSLLANRPGIAKMEEEIHR